MKISAYGFLLLALSANSQAGFFKSYDWNDWQIKKTFKVYDSEWVIETRVQSVSYSPLHFSRWFIWQNYSQNNGHEMHLVNKELGFNKNILDLIFFPQKDGSYKPLLKRPFLDKNGSIDYYGSYGVYEKNGALEVWLNPNSEIGTDRLLSPYTDCGYLTANEKVVYVTDRRHEPEVYYGELDLKTKKFYMRYTSAPIKYVYWSEWGSMTAPFLEDRNQYRGPPIWDAANKKYAPGALEVRPKYAFLSRVEDEARLPIICGEAEFTEAKEKFKSYLNNIWQPALDKELGRMSDHEMATLRREDCAGIGLNYTFGCAQINNYRLNDSNIKNIFPEGVKQPLTKSKPD